MAQVQITLESEAEAIAVLELLKTMRSKTGGDALKAQETLPDSDEPAPEKKAAAGKKNAAKEKKAPVPKEEPADESEESAISLSDVRAVALKLSKAGKQKQLKEIFAKYDAEKLSDIDAENYESLMADLEAANE